MIDNWLNSRFGDTRSASGGRELRVCCPFCKARQGRVDTKFHLYVRLDKPIAHCFRCDWKGHHLGLVMSVDGGSYAEAIQSIEGPVPDVGLFEELFSSRGLAQSQQLASTPDGYIPLMYSTREDTIESRAVWRYLIDRGVPQRLIRSRFGYVPGSMRAWVMVDVDWWQGRMIISGEPRYISPPWPKGDSLWNGIALATCDSIHICEGVFSAIAVGEHAIALCGKTMNELQAQRIVNAMDDKDDSLINILLDADAIQNAHVVAQQLVSLGYKGRLELRYMHSGDPADGKMGERLAWDWSVPVKYALQGLR